MNKYEAMVIIKPDLSDEEKKNLFKQIEEAIVKNNGQITQAGIWAEKRKLYFPIKKFMEGVYYLVAFSAPASTIKEVRSIYRINENILRVLFTRMDA
ncbi:MAG: 30S ribosomal protein S6 [Candidatus Omnitrophica bacterium]|jgi:small subunit ribosomal protein S6|nr:30S ribosomal protein S6 [Candidatus Omnitrophota bacterium]MDD3274536.1 30S ribosomal protein S6 [Candidatus Omnitrophota bacterium]MDD5078046.1 30S ribosomal protein S6 [Candidatus Omnitrophota bacterium]